MGGGEPSLLSLVQAAGAEGPQRLPHVRPAHGPARPSARRELGAGAVSPPDRGPSQTSARSPAARGRASVGAPAVPRARRAALAAAVSALLLGAFVIAVCVSGTKVT